MPASLLDGDDGSKSPTLGTGQPIVRAFSLSAHGRLAHPLTPAARRLKNGSDARVRVDYDKHDRR